MRENGCEGSHGAPSVPASPAAPPSDAAEGASNPKTLSDGPTKGKGVPAADALERTEGAGEATEPAENGPGSAEGGGGKTEGGGEGGTEGDGAPAKPVATLYVGNLPPEADEYHLMAIFYHFGPISNIQARACIRPTLNLCPFNAVRMLGMLLMLPPATCCRRRLSKARYSG